jgi:hypothetical protein
MKFLLLALCVTGAFAQSMGKTGDGVRVKKFGFLSFDVYRVTSFASAVPAGASKREALALAVVDKKLELDFLRDVEADKIGDAFRIAYGNCDFTDAGKVDALMAAFKRDFKKNDKVVINFTKEPAKTTFTGPDGKQLAFDGTETMLATWCIWLGKGVVKDQPKLGDELVEDI